MRILHEFDKAGSDPIVYTETLDSILLRKMQSIGLLRERLLLFKDHLKQEECLSGALTVFDKIKGNQNAMHSSQIEIEQPSSFGGRNLIGFDPYGLEQTDKRREPVDRRMLLQGNFPQNNIRMEEDMNLLENLNFF